MTDDSRPLCFSSCGYSSYDSLLHSIHAAPSYPCPAILDRPDSLAIPVPSFHTVSALPVIPEISVQFCHPLYFSILTQTITVNFQVFKHFFDAFFSQLSQYRLVHRFIRNVFSYYPTSMERVQLYTALLPFIDTIINVSSTSYSFAIIVSQIRYFLT